MLYWMKMDSNEFKWARRTNLEGLFNLQWITPRKTFYKTSYEPRKQWRMEEF